MSDQDTQVPLPDLNSADPMAMGDIGYNDEEQVTRIAAALESANLAAWGIDHMPAVVGMQLG